LRWHQLKETDQMLKSSDIAKELHISEGTVRAYAREGLIPFVETPGGHRRFVLEDVRTALEMAKKHAIEPLGEGDQTPRLAQQPPAAPLRRGRSRRRGITRASIAEARAAQGETVAPIPFIGIKGSSRFIVGHGAEV
jgi:excisionase family DNA binding protein